MNTVILAYSGGLDTSVIIPWLKEKYGNHLKIICYFADLGQKHDPDIVTKKALKSGAVDIVIDNLQDEFVRDYVFPALQIGALYEGKYPLATALGRPLIAKKMIDLAEQRHADVVCHGCTAKGNDQVRFDITFATLAPHLKIIAPLRDWEMTSREEEIEYAKKRGIDVPITKEKPYSLDENLWGQSIECGVLENPWTEPPEDAYVITSSMEEAPNDPELIRIVFEKGIPVSVNDKTMAPVDVVKMLLKIGAKHGIGRVDMVENRLLGIKSREIYESPAAKILFEAHSDLESLTVDGALLDQKRHLSLVYSRLVYEGQWFSPLREAIDAFVQSSQRWVSGEVRLKLYKGTVSVLGRRSPYSLYDESLSTYTKKDTFNHKDAEGFIRCFSLPLKMVGERACREKRS